MDQQAPADNGYYQNGYQQAPANNGYYQNEYPYPNAQYEYTQQNYTANDPYQPQTNSRKLVTSRWPASAGVMAVIHLLFFSVATIIRQMYYSTEMGFNILTPTSYIYILMVIAVPVLFFVHTKKLAFLTAIPMVVMALLDWIPEMVFLFGDFPPGEQAKEWIAFSLSMILLVLYLIQMIVRPASAAMPVIYLIFSIISLIYSHAVLLFNYVGRTVSAPPVFIAALLGTVGTIFLTISYIISMFSSRNR